MHFSHNSMDFVKFDVNGENLSTLTFVVLNIAACLILFSQQQQTVQIKVALVFVIAVAYTNLYIKLKKPTLACQPNISVPNTIMFSAFRCQQCNNLTFPSSQCEHCGFENHTKNIREPISQQPNPIQPQQNSNVTPRSIMQKRNNARLNNYHLHRERVFDEFGDPALHDTSAFQPSLGFMYPEVGKRDISHLLMPRQNNQHQQAWNRTKQAPNHELQYNEQILSNHTQPWSG